MNELRDGFLGLGRGMSEAVSPLLLPEGAAARGLNVSFRRMLAHTRPGLVEDAILPQGMFQGAGVWSLNSGDRLVFVVDGTVYALDTDTYQLYNMGTALDNEHQCYFSQVDRYMVVQDGRKGDANITLTVSDGVSSAERVVRVLSEAVADTAADAPTMTALADVTIPPGAVAGPFPITLTVPEGADPDDVEITATSTDAGLLHSGQIQVRGEAESRELWFAPSARTYGSTYVIVTASLAGATSTQTLKLTVPERTQILAPLLNPALVWNDLGSGTLEWAADLDRTYGGLPSIKAVLDPDTSEMMARATTTIDGGALGGTLSFAWACDCGSNASFACEIDGVEAARIRGEVGWTLATVDVPAGSSQVAWVYTGTDVPEDNAAWLSRVRYTADRADAVPIASEPVNTESGTTEFDLEARTVKLTMEEALDASVGDQVSIRKSSGWSFIAQIVTDAAPVYTFTWAADADNAPEAITDFTNAPEDTLEGAGVSVTLSSGESAAFDIDYSKPWALTFTGNFGLNSHKRFAQTGDTPNDGLDFFMWGDKLASRLYNRRIRFTSASTGSLSTPAPPDHWAQSVPIGRITRGEHTLQYRYDPTGSWKAIYDGELVMDVRFTRTGTPSNRSRIYSRGFSGTVRFVI